MNNEEKIAEMFAGTGESAYICSVNSKSLDYAAECGE